MALLECSVFEVFFGGARGGGKTDGMLGEWANHADRYGKDAIGLMLRRTRTELIETIERSRAIYSLLGWKYRNASGFHGFLYSGGAFITIDDRASRPRHSASTPWARSSGL